MEKPKKTSLLHRLGVSSGALSAVIAVNYLDQDKLPILNPHEPAPLQGPIDREPPRPPGGYRSIFSPEAEDRLRKYPENHSR